MSEFAEDFAWQKRFYGHFAEIITKAVRVTVASWEDDTRRNTDFVIAVLGNGTRAACRARRRNHRFEYYRRQFTIRSQRPSGAATEIHKSRDGWADFMVYGFESAPDSDRLSPWALINLHLWREYMNSGGRWQHQKNADGTRFAAFEVNEMPLGCVLDAEGHNFALDPSTPCKLCGRPCWTGTHRCCELNEQTNPGSPCPHCAASDDMSHYRYGWPA